VSSSGDYSAKTLIWQPKFFAAGRNIRNERGKDLILKIVAGGRRGRGACQGALADGLSEGHRRSTALTVSAILKLRREGRGRSANETAITVWRGRNELYAELQETSEK
jgi:hypothetical protein